MVSNTRDDFPEPETPVKTVIFRRGMSTEMFCRLFSRAPRTWMAPKRSDSEDDGDMSLHNCEHPALEWVAQVSLLRPGFGDLPLHQKNLVAVGVFNIKPLYP